MLHTNIRILPHVPNVSPVILCMVQHNTEVSKCFLLNQLINDISQMTGNSPMKISLSVTKQLAMLSKVCLKQNIKMIKSEDFKTTENKLTAIDEIS